MAIERSARRPIRRPPGRRTVRIFEENQPSEWRNAWVALIGFYILLTETGVRQVMNGFVEPIMETFNCTKSEADTALLMIPTTSSLLVGPMNSAVYQSTSARFTIILGGILSALGFILGTFCGNIYLLMLCTLMIGIGCSFLRVPIISVQCEYFKKKVDIVMGFISIGPGFGIFVLPRIHQAIMRNFDGDWRPAFYFVAVLYLFSAFLSVFITRKPSQQSSSSGCCTIWEDSGKIFKKLEFYFHLISCFCAASVTFIYLANILHLMTANNIEEPEHVYSWQGIASVIGKLGYTFVMSLNKIHVANLMIFAYFIAQLALSAPYLCYDLWQFRVQNSFAGLGIGLFQACLVPFLVVIVGPSQLSHALGFTNFVNGLAVFSSIWIYGLASRGTEESELRGAFMRAFWLGVTAIVLTVFTRFILTSREKHKRKPSMKQMKHSSELNTLANINAVENS